MEELLCSLGSRSRPEVIGLLPHIKYVPLFGKPPPLPPSLSLLTGAPHRSALLSVANTSLSQDKLDDNFYPRGLAL